MSRFLRLATRLFAFGLLAALLGQGAAAQPLPAAAAPANSAAAAEPPTVAELRARLDKIPDTIKSNDEVRELVNQLGAIGAQANEFIASRTGPLADLNARLGELGNAPPAGSSEDPDITRQRAALTKERNALDADIRLARLIAVDSQQRGNDLLAKRRALFEAQLTERSPSPLGRQFWNDIADAWPADLGRLRLLAAEIKEGLAVAKRPDARWAILGGVAAALLLALLGNWAAEHALARLASRVLPTGRLRRSLLVVAIVLTNVLLVGLAAQGVHALLQAQGVLRPQTRELAQGAVQSSIFIAFVVGLGRALLSNARPSWRLPPISDAMARRLAPFPWLTALIAVLVWAPAQVNAVVQASFAAVVTTHVATALALTALIAAMLMRLKAPREPSDSTAASGGEAKADAETDTAGDPAAGGPSTVTPADRPLWVGIITGSAAVLLIAVCVLVATGYVAMASFIAGQLTWTGIVVAAFYLLFKFADDLCMALVSSKSAGGLRLSRSFGFLPRTLDQAAVVLSGLVRIALFFYMLVTLAAPLGTSPGEVLQRSVELETGIKVGEFQLVPAAIASGVGVLILGFVVLRVLKRWLERSLLPHTSFEPGMQSSLLTLLGYVGGVLVIAIALSALGFGIERIAWVASALSVGIGFGLQAIVQNFISGLILLAEQPVKVGDWVVLGTAEGDVRRINVRATEIQLGDRSTLIVPNSEFITKIVRNMTLSNAEGRVLIRLPMPLTTDAQRARELMLEAFAQHHSMLQTPAPSVTLEGIEGGMLIFQAIGYVQSPRLAGGVRSDLMFSILGLFAAAGVPMAAPPAVAAAPAPPPAPGAITIGG
ncbi:Small-conductance mechanosensitive channel [Burkholderiales bacterium 8X]|nr:Small-conductance mechanosensitive channel [Burkholderiales bacterium 8X]